MTAHPWLWHWRGNLPAAATVVEYTEQPAPLPEPMRAEIEHFWEQRLTRRGDGVLFRGALAQLLEFRVKDDLLVLKLGRTDYAHWLYCSGRGGELATLHGEGMVSRPLALCAAVITADERLVLQRRSRIVAEGGGQIHVPGGHLNPDEHLRGGLPDPNRAMLTELEEELALPSERLHSGRLLGLIENLENGKPELLYSWRTNLTRNDILAHLDGARDRFEYSDLQFAARDGGGRFRIDAAPDEVAIPCRALLVILT